MMTLLGATGYTGRLIAPLLAAQGLPLQLAGRSRSRLAQLAAQLPGQPTTLVVDVRQPAALEALHDTTLLINCAGPFTDLGRPVAAYAARRGMRFLDISNELGYVHDVYISFQELARATGATLVPACGFEVALSDCAAALLARQLPGPLDEILVTYKLPSMGSSYGTRASALRSLATSWLAYEDGSLKPTRPCLSSDRVTIAEQHYPTLTFPSSEALTMPSHLAVRSVQTRMTITRFGALYGPRFIPAMIPLLNGPVGWGLRLLSRLAARPPDPERRARMPFALLVTARAGAQQASIVLQGQDPYGLTARIVACIAPQLLQGQPPSGVIAPAQAVDAAAFFGVVRSWGVDVSPVDLRSA